MYPTQSPNSKERDKKEIKLQSFHSDGSHLGMVYKRLPSVTKNDFDLTYQTKFFPKFNALMVYFCPNFRFFSKLLWSCCEPKIVTNSKSYVLTTYCTRENQPLYKSVQKIVATCDTACCCMMHLHGATETCATSRPTIKNGIHNPEKLPQCSTSSAMKAVESKVIKNSFYVVFIMPVKLMEYVTGNVQQYLHWMGDFVSNVQHFHRNVMPVKLMGGIFQVIFDINNII